jgi:hypothetical protein
LPLPVTASARTSRCCRSGGIDARCTGVGDSKPKVETRRFKVEVERLGSSALNNAIHVRARGAGAGAEVALRPRRSKSGG